MGVPVGLSGSLPVGIQTVRGDSCTASPACVDSVRPDAPRLGNVAGKSRRLFLKINGLRNSTLGMATLAGIAALAVCGAKAEAGQVTPSKAVVKELIESYSGKDPTKRFQFSDISLAPPRVLQVGEVYGLKGGTRVWLAKATYSVFTRAGDVSSPTSTCESFKDIQYFYIYKDEFGKWADYATAHPGTQDRNTYHGSCPNMPGVGIFSASTSTAR